MPKKRKTVPTASSSEHTKPKILARLAGEMHDITIAGQARRISTVELVMQKLRALALKGDQRVVKLLEHLGPQTSEAAKGAYLVVSEPYENMEETERALALHHRLIEEQKAEDPIYVEYKPNPDIEPAKAP